MTDSTPPSLDSKGSAKLPKSMADSGFTHLHLHTQYSLLDGAIHMDELAPAIKEQGMDAVAVTDHGNMFGAVFLSTGCKAR
ncbi:MAG: PHP domain-containing protein [Myxococcota bacterium]